MTVDEFKKANPEHAHLEGDDLWDAMTSYVIKTKGTPSMEEFFKQGNGDGLPFKDFGIFIPGENGEFKIITRDKNA